MFEIQTELSNKKIHINVFLWYFKLMVVYYRMAIQIALSLKLNNVETCWKEIGVNPPQMKFPTFGQTFRRQLNPRTPFCFNRFESPLDLDSFQFPTKVIILLEWKSRFLHTVDVFIIPQGQNNENWSSCMIRTCYNNIYFRY